MPMADARFYRRATAAALIVGPALFFIDNLIHPKELARGNEAEQLELIALHHDRWQIAHLIGFIGLIAICAAILGLAWVVRRSEPRLGLWAGALGLVGVLGFAFAFALDGYTWGILGQVNGDHGRNFEIESALREIQQSTWSLPYYALAVLGFVGGMLALALGLARGNWAGRPAAALLGVGALAVAVEGTIANNAYFIASSGLFLVGAIAVARDLGRLPDGRLAVAPGG